MQYIKVMKLRNLFTFKILLTRVMKLGSLREKQWSEEGERKKNKC